MAQIIDHPPLIARFAHRLKGVTLRVRNKAEEITNATPARLLPRETGTRDKNSETVWATINYRVGGDQNAFEKKEKRKRDK
ncbi:hypothetical protein X777_11498 [Ooceraea biroi]|uniref:Uncharacterized protein n=1 Tax=Ooceraea biroi TaxID=2015173 RepID=A0A026W4N7_OOCBI|nr:hypothetical protein X777_11498 [Ooceraea biroi]